MTKTKSMSLRVTLVVLGLCLSGAPVLAQEQPAAPPQIPPAPLEAPQGAAANAVPATAPVPVPDTAAATPSDATPAPQPAPAAQDGDYVQRLAMAQQMHEVRPTSQQIAKAIDELARNIPLSDREKFRTRMISAIDQKLIEDASIKAMAEVFTVSELQAMIDYYRRPEASAIADKMPLYDGMLQPTITRMLDAALLDLRTGGGGG